jgi:putative aldouronate transport system permease protein
MIRERSLQYKLVDGFIYIVLALIFLSCVLPFVHQLAVSFSSRPANTADRVGLLPVGFNLDNYGAVITRDRFLNSLLVSCLRVGVAVPLTLLVVALTAYPLALDRIRMPGRKAFMAIMIFANLFQVGLIPRYLSFKNLGLIDNFFVLIFPLLLNTFNVLILINFFRGIPYELVESAMLDGASHWKILSQIMVPLATPAMATIALFAFVQHWNSWFDGIVFLRDIKLWPMQSYLYQMLSTQALGSDYSGARGVGVLWPNVSPKGAQAAMLFYAILPIVIIYPLLQRYFVTGLTIGAVKG